MVTQFNEYLVKWNLTKNTIRSYEWTVKYFMEHYKVVRELQAADCKLTVAGNQQISGVYQAGEAKGEVCESSAEELFGECD